MSPVKHSFVVAAYGNSSHLEDCLRSLSAQSVKSPTIICTSTPHDGLKDLANHYGARLVSHRPNRGIGHDWNVCLEQLDTALVTLVHQDDLYDRNFTELKIEAHESHPSIGISFSDADEILVDGGLRKFPINLLVKRSIASAAFIGNSVVKSQFRRRLLFGFGNPVICTSVTFNRRVLENFRFREDLRTNMDWIAWDEIVQTHGAIRVKKILVHRRVHEGSETTTCIADGARRAEDAMVFETFWPKPIASLIGFIYRLSYSGYR